MKEDKLVRSDNINSLFFFCTDQGEKRKFRFIKTNLVKVKIIDRFIKLKERVIF